MTLTTVAMVGILLSLVFLVMGVLMESRCEPEATWTKGRQPVKRSAKKRTMRMMPKRKAA